MRLSMGELRARRWFFSLTMLSLAMCVAMTAVWVRSYFVGHTVQYRTPLSSQARPVQGQYSVSLRGGLLVR